MTDAIREILYPLGFLAQAAFFGRILTQWLSSEAKKESIVTPNFWKLSLLGNLLLGLHSIIQMQFHVCLAQTLNAVIAWRNLNLMKEKRFQVRFFTVLALLAASTLLVTCIFAMQNGSPDSWFRLPSASWFKPKEDVQAVWHIAGFVGITLFSARFWVQWIAAETKQASILSPSFWWCSLAGTLLSLSYFIQIKDPVNLIGPAFGIIPYARNLLLIYKTKKAVKI